ncbi:MAG: hypothetical protein QXH96_00100 [Candidatus Geothermarchaeota archaeon]
MVQYMKVKYNDFFQIPRKLGTDVFKEIVKLKGVEYVKGKGFLVKGKDALDGLNKVLIRYGLLLVPQINCFICGTEVDCSACEFRDVCERSVKECICQKCISSSNLLENYAKRSIDALNLILSSR